MWLGRQCAMLPLLGLLGTVLALGGGCGAPTDPLVERGVRVARGIAAGRVDDERVCAGCHGDIAGGYREVAMSRSVAVPGDPGAEGQVLSYRHPASGRVYQLEPRADQVWFSRWIEGPGGERRHLLELPIDLVIGSGAHARSFAVRTGNNELFLLPVTWYEGQGLLMSPGFDRREHPGLSRQVRRDCLVCHAATPELPVGGDVAGAPQRFPSAMGAIGCQTCHGPAADHARLALAGDHAAAKAALVDLGDLSGERRMALCETCHLQPSVALAATRRFDRGDYGFEVGMGLGDHRVAAQVHEVGRELDQVFEINHHAWRLRQSRCFVASAGRPVCTDCHDPHRKRLGAAMQASVRQVCLECHGSGRGCSEAEGQLPAAACASCHMGIRRPEDVVRVLMTDHAITRRPLKGALEPRPERDLEIAAMSFPAWGGRPAGPEGAAFLAISVLRSTGLRNQAALEELRTAVAQLPAAPREVILELARAELRADGVEAAQLAVQVLLARDPEDLAAVELLGLIDLDRGRTAAARESFDRVLAADPRRAEVWDSLGALELAAGNPAAATVALEQAVRWRDLAPTAWARLGAARAALGDPTGAEVAWRRALAIEPSTTAAWLGLAQSALRAGYLAGARRWLEEGALLVDDDGAGSVLAALQRLAAHQATPES